MYEPRSRTWTWRFDHPRARVWPLMADTQRFNEAAALPRHSIEEIPQPDGSVQFLGSAHIGPFRLAWRDMPVNWVNEEWFEHQRLFETGPFKSMIAETRLIPAGAGTDFRYTITVEPANSFGRALLATGFFSRTERNFSRLAGVANAFLSGEHDRPFPYRPPPVSKVLSSRVSAIVDAIEATPNGHGLARRLADFILESQEVDLWRLRPLALARAWGCRELHAIELCLQAVRAGLLDLRWELLCPRCRVAKAWSGGLDHLPAGAHCPSCNIDYGRDFASNVEAGFHPAPAIRRLETGEYCMWGPMSVPHVKAQILLQPGETREVSGRLAPGPYRLRSLEPGPESVIDWPGDRFPAVRLHDNGIEAGPLAPSGQLRFENTTSRPLTAVIEDRRWVADALTGDRVTALQGFRDLFGEEVLRPGDEVSVGRVALLFSDLQGSTALYQRIGDAPAYRLVRDHFAFLTDCVRRHEGAVIKTIGDAVMAAFTSTSQAVEAALDIQRRVHDFNRGQATTDGGSPVIFIKLGIHVGPAIVVTLNDQLDYFGSSVNMTARLQGMAEGGEIVLSAEAMADSEVTKLVEGLHTEQDLVDLKGFSGKVPMYRLRI